jgi:hypothetical protein
MEPVNPAGRGLELITLPGRDLLSCARQVGMLPSAGSRSDLAITTAFNAHTDLRG